MSICEYCNNNHNSSYGSGRFCSQKCARGFSSREKRQEINKKVSGTLKQYYKINPKPKYEKPLCKEICAICGIEFVAKCGTILCSRSCLARAGGRKSAEIQAEKRRSKNEQSFAELCMQYFNEVFTNKIIFNGWDADIIIEDHKIAVLWNGKWHYEKVTDKHSVKQVQNRDKIKIREIEKAGYVPYIIKDMGRENECKVEKEFTKFILWTRSSMGRAFPS
jgi:hypothetical protein